LIVVQQYLRSLPLPSRAVHLILDSAPNLIVGFCFPFSILITPRAFTRKTADRLFLAWCIVALIMLVAFEIGRPFKGAQTFDYFDIAASLIGVSGAVVVYHLCLKERLSFG